MSHHIANLEHHHFKYALFRRPGDLHVHFFGTATLSFSDGIKARDGDIFEIEAPPFSLPLRNPFEDRAAAGHCRKTSLNEAFISEALKRDIREPGSHRIGRRRKDRARPAHSGHRRQIPRSNWWPPRGRHSTVDGVANFASIEAMLDGVPGLDAVAICTPPQVHYEAAKLALGRGKHVLLEKPPCTSVLQLEALVALARRPAATLYQTWHSQHAHGVAPAEDLLKQRKLRPRAGHVEGRRAPMASGTDLDMAGGRIRHLRSRHQRLLHPDEACPRTLLSAIGDIVHAVQLRGADRRRCGIRHR